MNRNLQQFLQERMGDPPPVQSGKIMAVAEAVRKFVRPGMSIHFGSGYAPPTAALYEIARQFWGKDPGFTLISSAGGAQTFGVFVHGRLCKKIISSLNADSYPFPSPSPILVKAFLDGSVQFEDWTMLTHNLRLLAGALGVPFLPTKSISGSGMELENADAFCRIADPFHKENATGLVKALNPSISLAHGVAADAEGNTLIAAPHSGNAYGALAAKEGVIVTVERIVDADFIRRHSYMTRIPSHVVRAVCLAPFGAHPIGLHSLGVPEFEGYGEDETFIMDARLASRDTQAFQSWIDDWILGCRDHQDYVSRLGHHRVWYLKGRIHEDSWTSELSDHEADLSLPEEPTPAEILVLGAAGKLKKIIKAKDYRLALCGIGVSNLAAWMTYYDLLKEGIHLELMAEIGFFGYSPRPGDPYLFSFRNLGSCTMTPDIFTVLGLYMCGSRTSGIGVIGAGQVDRFGNVNTTKIPSGYLVGAGGANDLASAAGEVVVTFQQVRSRFVDRVSYISSPGNRVTTVVTQMGIYEKPIGNEELRLTGYFLPATPQSEEEIIRDIRAACGWDLKVDASVEALARPDQEDVKFLRCFDPRRLFLGKNAQGTKR